MSEDITVGGVARVTRLHDGLPLAYIQPKLRGTPSPDIDAVERRRAHLWVVTALLLLASASAVILLFYGRAEGGVDELLPEVPFLRYAFLALAIAFMLYVIDQERRLRRLTRALFDERVLTAGLQARIADLSTLTKVGRVVNSVLTLEEVLEVILTSAFELTGSTSGSVMLRDGDRLRVAASAGEKPAPTDTYIELGSGVAGWVAEQREPILITGKLAADQFPERDGRSRRGRSSGSSVIAPLIAGGELLGVLAVERPPGSQPFTETQMRSVALFAEHAATAVSNAYRHGPGRAAPGRLNRARTR